jgi:hypothetical protein
VTAGGELVVDGAILQLVERAGRLADLDQVAVGDTPGAT